MSTNKRGLGKGLGALIPQGSVFVGGRTIVNLDIAKIVPNPRQPRSEFTKENLHDLANSIKEQGVIEPILTRQRDGKYELVAGERRFRAAKMAGLAMIPAIVKEFTDEQSLELALIENLQREDLNPLDEAEGYARLIKEFNLTQEQVAKKVSKERSTVANMLRLLTLPDKIKRSLAVREIGVGHARALLALDSIDKQLELWEQIVKNSLNVRDVEVLTRSGEKRIKATHKRPLTSNTELNALVEQLTTHLGTKVKIMGNQNRGRIEVEYFSREDLERLLDLMTGGQFKQPAPFMMAAAPNSFIQSEAPTQIQ